MDGIFRMLANAEAPFRLAPRVPQHLNYNEENLLAALQALLVLMIMLCFGIDDSGALSKGEADTSSESELLISVWNVKHRLATAGLFAKGEIEKKHPAWRDWAIAEAKRRTVLSLHHFEWVWSIHRGYPVLTCFEVGPLPAPAPGYLWQETDKKKWQNQYADWLRLWKQGCYNLAELFYVNIDGPLSARAETWLCEADEFGGMLMAEGTYG